MAKVVWRNKDALETLSAVEYVTKRLESGFHNIDELKKLIKNDLENRPNIKNFEKQYSTFIIKKIIDNKDIKLLSNILKEAKDRELKGNLTDFPFKDLTLAISYYFQEAIRRDSKEDFKIIDILLENINETEKEKLDGSALMSWLVSNNESSLKMFQKIIDIPFLKIIDSKWIDKKSDIFHILQLIRKDETITLDDNSIEKLTILLKDRLPELEPYLKIMVIDSLEKGNSRAIVEILRYKPEVLNELTLKDIKINKENQGENFNPSLIATFAVLINDKDIMIKSLKSDFKDITLLKIGLEQKGLNDFDKKCINEKLTYKMMEFHDSLSPEKQKEMETMLIEEQTRQLQKNKR